MGRALGIDAGRVAPPLMGLAHPGGAVPGLGSPSAAATLAPGVGTGRAFGGRAIGGYDVVGFEAGTLEDVVLQGTHLTLRPLRAGDRDAYRSLIAANRERLSASGVGPDADAVAAEVGAFDEMLEQQDLLRVLDQSHSFGVFAGDDLVGEFGIEGLVRGHVQSAFVVAWIDEGHAGREFAPEAYVLLAGHAFDDLGLHRIEAAVLTDNEAVKAGLAKLKIRSEGVSPRYLEVNGEWLDHERFVLTAEEWTERRDELAAAWLA